MSTFQHMVYGKSSRNEYFLNFYVKDLFHITHFKRVLYAINSAYLWIINSVLGIQLPGLREDGISEKYTFTKKNCYGERVNERVNRECNF